MSDLLPEVVIEQVNLGYDAVEDRLLLKLGLSDQTEYGIWLTRRLTKGLWNIVQKTHDVPLLTTDFLASQPEPLLGGLARLEKPQSLDFSEEYRSHRSPRTAEPLLATGCQIVQGNGQTVLEMQSRKGTVKIPLAAELAVALSNMLQLATREAGWDLHLVPEHVVLKESAISHVLH